MISYFAVMGVLLVVLAWCAVGLLVLAVVGVPLVALGMFASWAGRMP